ncbi:hypothetical protein ACFU8I_15845 [Streptomyces sp. NPDC057540]|uniref:hypothetical protein n=1 Tax=Streptomyces sp. NPDC057540 TaxID=3346160 RepID=UPI0036A7A36B
MAEYDLSPLALDATSIDLAGRDAEGRFVVVQCKDYREFTAGDLRKAVETFTSGRRPFNADHLIVATSAPTERTQLADELATLQREHEDLELDLWGAEQINDLLRYQADVVARFWTRETAEVFCTGARPFRVSPLLLPTARSRRTASSSGLSRRVR